LPVKRTEESKQVNDQTATPTQQNAPASNTTKKDRDAIIPAKDMSPDDLEILD
jgi:hypothetical protein